MTRIVCDPDVMMGKPTVEGTRLTVENLLEKLASGYSQEDLLQAHPRLTPEGIRAAFDFIRDDALVKAHTLTVGDHVGPAQPASGSCEGGVTLPDNLVAVCSRYVTPELFDGAR